MHKFLSFFINRITIMAILVVLQLSFLLVMIWSLSQYAAWIYVFFTLLSFILVVYVVNKKNNPNFTMAWIFIIGLSPLFGGALYLVFGDKKVPKELSNEALRYYLKKDKDFLQDKKVIEEIKSQDKFVSQQVNYIKNFSYFPVNKNTKITYLNSGEKFFESLIKEIKKAKKFIFLEYFIIEEGLMWNTILDLLVEKVEAGVDVRVLYDDAGCIQKLPTKYNKKLEELGIKTAIFNPLKARLIMQMNNRDHRKLLVIDGIKAYFGGINLADEYINNVQKFGHWKDNAVLVEGEAANNATLMFLQFWNYIHKTTDDISLMYHQDFYKYKDEKGYVQVFSDSPTDDENISEGVHINLINQAENYVYITTPYVVPGYELNKALTLAAKNGIDVRLIVPGQADKWYVYLVTQSNYKHLLKNGVKIYEYTPGFIHAKTYLVDDNKGYVGSCNMDLRSYNMHFENGVFMYDVDALSDIKDDLENIFAECKLLTLEDIKKYGIFRKIAMAVMNLFSFVM